MAKLLFRSAYSLILAFVLTLSATAAETFQPHEILRLHIRSYTEFVNAATTFTSQISSKAASNVMLLSAMFGMNPDFALINPARPMTFLLLTGAGTVKNKTGEYAPDLFLCAAVHLREGGAPDKNSPNAGMRFSTLPLPDGRTLLYRKNPLYEKMIREKATSLFPIRRDLPQMQLEMDLASISQLPLFREALANGVASATEKHDDLQPDELTRKVEKTIRQAEKLIVGLRFSNAETLHFNLGLALKPGSEAAKLFNTPKSGFDFSTVPILDTATDLYLLHIPDDPELKNFLIRQVRQMAPPSAFPERCISSASGALLVSLDQKTQRTKSYIALRPGAARQLLAFMKEDKTIRELSPGLWIVDYQEDGVSTYAKVSDNGLYLVTGQISEVTAKRILDDRTPLPATVKLNSDVFAVYKKKGSSDTFSRIGVIRYDKNRLSGEILLHPSDFPKEAPAPRPPRPSAGK